MRCINYIKNLNIEFQNRKMNYLLSFFFIAILLLSLGWVPPLLSLSQCSQACWPCLQRPSQLFICCFSIAIFHFARPQFSDFPSLLHSTEVRPFYDSSPFCFFCSKATVRLAFMISWPCLQRPSQLFICCVRLAFMISWPSLQRPSFHMLRFNGEASFLHRHFENSLIHLLIYNMTFTP